MNATISDVLHDLIAHAPFTPGHRRRLHAAVTAFARDLGLDHPPAGQHEAEEPEPPPGG